MSERLLDIGAGDPPVILLGGRENTLSAARRFVRAGVTTVVVDHERGPALRSRGVNAVDVGSWFDQDAVTRWLFGDGRALADAVLIPMSDEALSLLVEHYDALGSVYRPALLDPAVVDAMLDKRRTLELAAECGVPSPRQWILGPGGVDEIAPDLVYPIIVKPVQTFESPTKHLRAHDEAELREHVDTLAHLPSGVVLNEFIPGGDELLSSYYAVRTPDSGTLLEFTKRVDRRNPPNKGGATYHELIDLPETAAMGRRFFDHVGVVGLANIEFKLDVRTGELKIIECNHRITAALELMQRAGIDLVGAVYLQALGRLESPLSGSGHGRLWYPMRDLISFRMSGDGIRPWLRRPWRGTAFPYWDVRDPLPSFELWARSARHSVDKHLTSWRARLPMTR